MGIVQLMLSIHLVAMSQDSQFISLQLKEYMSYQRQLQQEHAKIDVVQDDATKQKSLKKHIKTLSKKIKKLLNPFKIKLMEAAKLWVRKRS